MDEDSFPEYLIKAQHCVDAELSRLNSYMDSSSKDDLMRATQDELLKKHQKELLAKDTGIDRILERTTGSDADGAKDDLSRIYQLYHEITDGLQPLADAMKGYITHLGLNFIQHSKVTNKSDKEHQLIRSLITLHDQFLNIVKINCQSDQIFHKALKEAFGEVINKEYYASNLLAKYIDYLLKRDNKLVVNDLDATMEHVANLYGYIRDKDIFERDYQMYLANRLLQDLSASEQNDKTMIGKLKNEVAYYGSKLGGMLMDIQREKELMKNRIRTERKIELAKKAQEELLAELDAEDNKKARRARA